MNGQHIVLTPTPELLQLIAPLLLAEGLTTEAELADRSDWFNALVDLLKPRGRTTVAIAELMRTFLAPTVDYDLTAVAKLWRDGAAVSEGLRAIRAAFAALPEWEPAAIERALRDTADSRGVPFGKLVHPLRLALTGSQASPGIDQVVWFLGRDLVDQRIEAACAYIARENPV
jgi:glutamyl-tRNA synthetase